MTEKSNCTEAAVQAAMKPGDLEDALLSVIAPHLVTFALAAPACLMFLETSEPQHFRGLAQFTYPYYQTLH